MTKKNKVQGIWHIITSVVFKVNLLHFSRQDGQDGMFMYYVQSVGTYP